MTYNVFGGTLSLTQSINQSEQSAQKSTITSSQQRINKQNCDIFAKTTTQLNDYFSIGMKIKHLLIITLFLFNSLLYNDN